ncbi:MAG TPA: response regulator transcription factor [Terriglobales bacterium]|nr:response regulator transcription factor [Terriglobales bacterium]
MLHLRVVETLHSSILPNCILIVDDHAVIRRTLRQLFESHAGWEVCGEAVNGLDAIEKAQQLKPDLIVLDLSMPEMDGLQAARVLKTLLPTVPVILFTNFGEDPFIEQEALAVGIREVVSKANAFGLLNTVEAVLQSQE